MTNIKQQPKLDMFEYKGQPIKMTLGTLVIISICAFLIVIATFTQISFNHFIIPSDFWSFLNSGDISKPEVYKNFIKHYRYIPQLPVIMFIAGLLGRKFGVMSVTLYILTGLFLYPVFALGGGPKYVLEYNFGYILAYIPAVFFAGSIIKTKFSIKNVLKAVIIGVLTVHAVGVLYTIFIGVLIHNNIETILGWIITQSGLKIAYDIFFGVIAIIIAKFLKRGVLWLIMSE